MNTPDRETCLKWAYEAGVPSDWRTKPVETLCHRVWNEALEAGAKKCEENSYVRKTEDGWVFACDEIRKLKVTK